MIAGTSGCNRVEAAGTPEMQVFCLQEVRGREHGIS